MNTEVLKVLLEAKILDPENVHHEFVDGMHGQKLDFDRVTTGSELYDAWVEKIVQELEERYTSTKPTVIIGVANGTNRLAHSVAKYLPNRPVSLETEKTGKTIRLSQKASKYITRTKPELVIIVEDVGTTGSSCAQVAVAALEAGAQKVEVQFTWQRRPVLEKLITMQIPYHSLINELVATYTPHECRTRGYCAQGYILTTYGKH